MATPDEIVERGRKFVTGDLFAAARGPQPGILGQIKAAQGGVAGALYKSFFPERYNKLADKAVESLGIDKKLPGAAMLNDVATMRAMRSDFGQRMRTGSKLGMSMGTRLIADTNASVRGITMRAMGRGLQGANAVSKIALGASLGQLGFATAVVGGIGMGIGNALGISGQQVLETTSAIHQSFKQASKPVYGYSELGQSVQGLTFGLHNRRRG